MVVLPTPPLPASAIVVVIGFRISSLPHFRGHYPFGVAVLRPTLARRVTVGGTVLVLVCVGTVALGVWVKVGVLVAVAVGVLVGVKVDVNVRVGAAVRVLVADGVSLGGKTIRVAEG